MNTLTILKDADQDFEWYPTTQEMIEVVKRHIPEDAESIMDIGSGDGRVLLELAKKCEHAKLYSIEKSFILVQQHSPKIIPVGTDFWEQNLSALPAQYIFCNPPYSQYEEWMERIISMGYAKKVFMIVPQRWSDSQFIKEAIAKREATTRGIWLGDFRNAERQARAQVEIVEITYQHVDGRYYRSSRWAEGAQDPFDVWFHDNIDMFDKVNEETDPKEHAVNKDKLALKLRKSDVEEMVDSYLADYEHLESNYRKIFELDGNLLRELGVNVGTVRDGLKAKIRGLKTTYWGVLFDRLDAITSRLSTKSRRSLLDKLIANNTIDFTSHNIRAVALWAINNVNEYIDTQLVELFEDLATGDNAHNYKSNQKTWEKNYWRYRFEDHSHFTLDYRIIKDGSRAIYRKGDWSQYEYPGNLHNNCHDTIADMIAVFSNLGFRVSDLYSKSREWSSGKWQDFEAADGTVIFQVKGYLNGNLHIRVNQKAMKALNIKASQLLGWIGSIEEVEEEMGYDHETAEKYFNLNQYITINNLPMLAAPEPEPELPEIPDFIEEVTEEELYEKIEERHPVYEFRSDGQGVML